MEVIAGMLMVWLGWAIYATVLIGLGSLLLRILTPPGTEWDYGAAFWCGFVTLIFFFTGNQPGGEHRNCHDRMLHSHRMLRLFSPSFSFRVRGIAQSPWLASFSANHRLDLAVQSSFASSFIGRFRNLPLQLHPVGKRPPAASGPRQSARSSSI